MLGTDPGVAKGGLRPDRTDMGVRLPLMAAISICAIRGPWRPARLRLNQSRRWWNRSRSKNRAVNASGRSPGGRRFAGRELAPFPVRLRFNSQRPPRRGSARQGGANEKGGFIVDQDKLLELRVQGI